MAAINKTRQFTFTVEIGTNRSLRLLTQNTVLDGATIVAIRTRRAGANRKSLLGKSIVNDANFEAATILLKSGSEDVWDQVPVEHIEKASNIAPEQGFPVNLNNVDWNTTKIEVAEGVALDTGKVFEFTVEFTK